MAEVPTGYLLVQSCQGSSVSSTVQTFWLCPRQKGHPAAPGQYKNESSLSKLYIINVAHEM